MMFTNLDAQLKILTPLLNSALKKMNAQSETVVIVNRQSKYVIYGIKILFNDEENFNKFYSSIKHSSQNNTNNGEQSNA